MDYLEKKIIHSLDNTIQYNTFSFLGRITPTHSLTHDVFRRLCLTRVGTHRGPGAGAEASVSALRLRILLLLLPDGTENKKMIMYIKTFLEIFTHLSTLIS